MRDIIDTTVATLITLSFISKGWILDHYILAYILMFVMVVLVDEMVREALRKLKEV